MEGPPGYRLQSVVLEMASRKGFEPLTYGLGNRCSIRLNYRKSPRDAWGQP